MERRPPTRKQKERSERPSRDRADAEDKTEAVTREYDTNMMAVGVIGTIFLPWSVLLSNMIKN